MPTYGAVKNKSAARFWPKRADFELIVHFNNFMIDFLCILPT